MSVSTWHYRNLGHDVFFWKREGVTKNAIEFFCSVACVFDVLLLVLSYRYFLGVIEENIRSHEHWVVERTDIDLFVTSLSVLECVRTHEVRHGGDGIENPCELGVRGHV